MTNPRTYSKALPLAEIITVDELEQLLARSKGSVTILKPRTPAIHAHVDYVDRYGANRDRLLVLFDHCTRNGYGASGSVTTFIDCPVFDFYNLDRLVTVESCRLSR